MNEEKLNAAIREAREFLRRARTLKEVDNEVKCMWACKESGAVRRQSMELTRSLAELRKP